MSRLSLGIGAAEGDNTGDHARVGSNKINLNFAELYAFLGGDTLTQTAGSVLLGNGTNPVSSFASTAGRLLIGNGASGLTDDANLTWDATNGLVALKPISCQDTGTNAERFGSGARALGTNDVVIGQGATSTSNGSGNVVIGQGASVTGFGINNIVIGQGSSTSFSDCVVIGKSHSVATSLSTCLGFGNHVTAGGSGTIGVIGVSATQSHVGGFLISVGVSSKRDYELMYGYEEDAAIAPSFRMTGSSSQYLPRDLFRIGSAWVDSTDATRKARVLHYVNDTAEREYMRAEGNGSAVLIGFFGATAVVKPATTGTTTGFTAGAGTAVDSAATFTGNSGTSAYTIGDVVLALKQLGLLAA